MVGVVGHLEGNLRERCLVELLHEAHDHGVEVEIYRAHVDVGRDRLGDGVALKEREECLFHREISGVTRHEDPVFPGARRDRASVFKKPRPSPASPSYTTAATYGGNA